MDNCCIAHEGHIQLVGSIGEVVQGTLPQPPRPKHQQGAVVGNGGTDNIRGSQGIREQMGTVILKFYILKKLGRNS
jgi:hypothetical protein